MVKICFPKEKKRVDGQGRKLKKNKIKCAPTGIEEK
jgi:hypothetical protein